MINNFSQTLLYWFDQHGRKNLPWQQSSDPYRIWLSEIMLQQTQVKTVIPYFEKFCARFPSVKDLADAPEDEVMHLWSGLGYYARARNLHHAAKQVVNEYAGEFPQQQHELEALKGVGRSTAAAIRAQAFGEQAAILDGNVKRVLARLFAIEEWPGQSAVEKRMWELSESLLPKSRLRDYTQAIMDLGATLCTRSRPDCNACPFQQDCLAYQNDKIADLPARKPKKFSPTKEIAFLLILNNSGEVLLQKRPPTGIWGGLWSFPESELDQVENSLSDIGLAPEVLEHMEPGEHVFSHFRLRYHPVLVIGEFTGGLAVQEPENQIWYSSAQPQELGLAAPVSKLIKRIQLGESNHK